MKKITIIKEILEVLKTPPVKEDESTLKIKETTLRVIVTLSFCFGVFYAALYYFLGAYKTSIAEIMIIVGFLPFVGMLRRKFGYESACHYFIFVYTLTLTVCAWFTGGIYSPSSLWLLIPPFIASVLMGATEIFAWAVIAAINILTIGYLDSINFFPESEITSHVKLFYIFGFVTLIVFIMGFMLVTHYMRLKVLIQSEKYQKNAQRNEYLATFAQVTAGMAHEINNPLTVALGHSKKLKKLSLTDQSNDVVLGIDKIISSIERISKIIISMRNLSRDASHEELDKFSLSEVVEDTRNLFVNKFKDREIDFSVQYNDLEDLSIYSHKVQLGQVLFNLLKNSMDEVVKINERWVNVNMFIKKSHLFIEVVDSGEGVDRDNLDKIFSPFYSTKDVGEGTGLGLSLSYSIMKKNGGDLYLDTKHKSTCFVMKVPLKL